MNHGRRRRSRFEMKLHTLFNSPAHAEARMRLLPSVIVGLIVIVGLGTIADIFFDRHDDHKKTIYRTDEAAAHAFQLAIADAEVGVSRYVVNRHPASLAQYHRGIVTLDNSTLLPKLEAFAAKQPPGHGPPVESLDDIFRSLRSSWDTAIRLVADNRSDEAAAVLESSGASLLSDRLRNYTMGFLREQSAEAASWDAWGDQLRSMLHMIHLAASAIAALAMVYAFGRIIRAIKAGFEAREQTERLFAMTDMLQSASGQDDTNEVLRATAAKLMPGFGGALYVFNNSRDRLDLSTQWGSEADDVTHLAPNSCWALKRGKPHLNNVGDGALRCGHAAADQVTLEIPMAARGELYGLLQIGTIGPEGVARLTAVQPVATAIADAMSLALSSIALRERLRNQALRDPLTGLYNRRFLEEMLDRLCLDAERRKNSIAAIMIDLDHFKKLNDQNGHAAGDAVLRDVATAILSCLRSSDVACRYGGEELAILLPDCTMALATGKAEQIRNRITEMTHAAGLSVTASLGVAAIPESAAGPGDLLPNADAALYQAKQNGRDRVAAAPPRNAAQHLSLIDNGIPGASNRSSTVGSSSL
jgi:diguanylate cyclase (GGDEF)-like protein